MFRKSAAKKMALQLVEADPAPLKEPTDYDKNFVRKKKIARMLAAKEADKGYRT